MSKNHITEPISKRKKKFRWIPYLIVGIAGNAAIWVLALLYLKNAPVIYTSEWALVLPGAAPSINLNLPNIGQASSSGASVGGNPLADPRANYEYILTNQPVLLKAAQAVKMSVEEFDKPRVKLLDNTTVIKIQVTGRTPEEALAKSRALYQAFSARVEFLRTKQIAQQDMGVAATLASAQNKLQVAQERLSRYKASSGLSSRDQLGNLSINIEQLRKEQVVVLAQQQQATQRFNQLSRSLGVSSEEAANAFILKSDQIFQQNLKDYSDSSANLNILLSKWGPNHPVVAKELFKQKAARTALLERGNVLLGKEVSESLLARLNLSSSGSGSAQEGLFQQVVIARAEVEGLKAQALEFDRQIAELEAKFQALAQKESVLDSLQRDVQIAEAIFSSTLAQLDLGKANKFSNYPLVQMLVEPSLPEPPSTLKNKIVLLGALVGSLLFTAGLILLWLKRKPSRLSDIEEAPLPLESYSYIEPVTEQQEPHPRSFSRTPKNNGQIK